MINHIFVFVCKNKSKIMRDAHIDDSTFVCFCKFLKTKQKL